MSVKVLLAETSAQRRQGMQGVASFPDGVDGMLFTQQSPRPGSYHMRNVQLPLDVWWFDETGRLIGSAGMSTCESDCVSYASPGAYMWALETPAGEFEFGPGAEITVDA